ncbi:MAG TPA: lipopolysaccharide heptosyltransferase II [Isosphaeraceae bacterium]|jgi:heptosyltransferase-2
MTIAIVCPNLIGDTAMATPTFRAIRAGFRSQRIVAVVRPGVAPILDGGPWFDDRILCDHRATNAEHRPRAALDRLRGERVETAVLLPNSFRSAWLVWRAGALRRVGYARGGRSLLLTDRLGPPRDRRGRFRPTPIVEYYLALARRLGCPVDSLRTELHTTPEDEHAADRALADLGITPGATVVCLNNGGAFGPAKSWPEEHFATLARRLAVESSVDVLVLCGPAEREAARGIVAKAAHPRVVGLADQPLSLGLSKACVRRSALLVTTDSGPRHFAPAFDVPVLTLFGPTHIAWTRTNHPLSLHILNPVDCGPCQQPVCPERHHLCMRDLDPDSVLRAATKLLAIRRPSPLRPHFGPLGSRVR